MNIESKPVLFLDWDDTLYPTTNCNNGYINIMPKDYVCIINEFLDFCNKNFNTFIVTNMSYDGLKYYVNTFGIEIPCLVYYTREFPYLLDKSLLFEEIINCFDKICDAVITIGDSIGDHNIFNFDGTHHKFKTYIYKSFDDCIGKICEIRVGLEKLMI